MSIHVSIIKFVSFIFLELYIYKYINILVLGKASAQAYLQVYSGHSPPLHVPTKGKGTLLSVRLSVRKRMAASQDRRLKHLLINFLTNEHLFYDNFYEY